MQFNAGVFPGLTVLHVINIFICLLKPFIAPIAKDN